MKPSYSEMTLAVDVFAACIETRVLPDIGSPCHRKMRDLVERSGCKPKRKRLRLKGVP